MQLQNCPHCGVQVVPAADGTCPNCRNLFYAPAYPREEIRDSAFVRMLIPVGRSIWAILAGYLGLYSGFVAHLLAVLLAVLPRDVVNEIIGLFFSVLVIPAPFAVLFGILALREIRRNPKKHGMGRAIFGIVCGFLAMGCLIVFFSIMLARKI